MQSLSKNMNFTVNGYQILLGKALDVAALEAHGIAKAGFWARLLLRPERGELLYWSKNCVLSYLTGGDNIVSPVVDTAKKEKALFGTVAYLWYKKNKLSKLGFQIVQSASFVALTLFEDFEKKISEAIGPPDYSAETQRVWEKEGQRLVLVLPMNNQYGYIHLLYSE